MFGAKKFYKYVCKTFPKEFTLAPEIQSLMRWLEQNGQHYRYRHSHTPFLAAIPAPSIDDLTSVLAFQPESDLMHHWVGNHKADMKVFPFMRCGFDGSFLALWRGETDRYVFLGSEGAAFVVAQTAVDFILLVTMGYEAIEGADDLLISPRAQWELGNNTSWPEPVLLKKWVQETFQVSYPARGEDLRTGVPSPDPFRQYVDGIVGHAP